MQKSRFQERAIPLLVAAGLAFLVGMVVGAGHQSGTKQIGERFIAAWSKSDYVLMYQQLTDQAREENSFADFANAYRDASATATMISIKAGDISSSGDELNIPVTVKTRIFGNLKLTQRLPTTGSDSGRGIAWEPSMTFPELQPGEQLTRDSQLAERAAIVARDGTDLASGSLRTSPLGSVATSVVGDVGAAPPERKDALYAAGFPEDAQVGTSGLELAFNSRLAGLPGGTLTAGTRVIARSEPKPGKTLRTSIDPQIQKAAVEALQGRYGGIAAIKPTTGEVLALAGIASSALQPPGSTFKMITVSAALEADAVSEKSSFPVETAATIEGVELKNSNGESCGGSLTVAFAKSCNSVFAPLGVKVGGEKLVETAERFGFNQPPPFPGALASTIPKATEIGDDLAVGSSAIGQGQVQATALEMASIAATVGTRGKLHKPVLLANQTGDESEAISEDTARVVERLMLAVVSSGTGTPAAIPGVKVAGKTGTAELEATDGPAVEDEEEKKDPDEPPSTDAWFAAYAPAGKPKIAVAAMFVRAGHGSDVAAPAVREVLLAALKR